MGSGKQFLIVNVLFGPWHHLENVEEFLLAESNELFKLLGSCLLAARSFVVDCGTCYQIGLLGKGLQVLLVLKRHLRGRCCLLLRTYTELSIGSI